jgi:uncharacterized protein YjiS (DUF1127 family)
LQSFSPADDIKLKCAGSKFDERGDGPNRAVAGMRMERVAMASRPIAYQADLDSAATLARQNAHAAFRPWSVSAWLVELAMRVARVVRAEARIRRNTRELMAMNDAMLKDIGLSRAEVGRAVRYGRDW